MKPIVKVVAAPGMAVALLLAGAVVFAGSPQDPVAESAPPTAPTSGTLLLPAVASGSLEEAIAGLQERLRTIPDDGRSYASLGLAYVARGRVTGDPSWYPKAESALAESVRIDGRDNVEAALGLGALALARHDFEAALEHARLAVELNPYGSEAYGVIGDALVELGRYDEAFDAFQTMVDTRPDLSSYARVSYARELIGDVDGAVQAMQLAFDSAGMASDAAWAAYQLGELAWSTGEVPTAARWYGRGLDLDPTFAPNLAGLGKVAWARGDTGLAIERFTDVVARYPSPEFVVALADLYATSGHAELAADQEEVVRAMHDLAAANGVNVDLELALFDADHGDPEASLAAARAEWSRRRGVHVADALAWALYANDRFEEAARYADRALELGTRNALFLFHAGMIERALGHGPRARSLLADALALNPNFSIQHAATAAAVLSRLEAAR
jgi:tetratricopeptide (TPR) repeat protein